jgi:hypothetical protein
MSAPDMSPVNCAVAAIDWAAVVTLPRAGDVGAAGSAANNDRAGWTAASTMAHACKTDTS